MKRIADAQSLKGQSETISLTDLRKQPGEVFQQVAMGKTFLVTKAKKAVAWIRPAKRLVFLDSTDGNVR